MMRTPQTAMLSLEVRNRGDNLTVPSLFVAGGAH
jgi:hypothetical protein